MSSLAHRNFEQLFKGCECETGRCGSVAMGALRLAAEVEDLDD